MFRLMGVVGPAFLMAGHAGIATSPSCGSPRRLVGAAEPSESQNEHLELRSNKKDSFVNAVNAKQSKMIKVGWTKNSFVNAMKSNKIKVGWKQDSFVNTVNATVNVSKHPVFKCSNILQTGVVMKRKKGRISETSQTIISCS